MQQLILVLVALFLLSGTAEAQRDGRGGSNSKWESTGSSIQPKGGKSVAIRKPYPAFTSGVTLTVTESNGVFSTAGVGTSPWVVPIPAPSSTYEGVTYTLLQVGTTRFQIAPSGGQFRGLYPTNANGDKLQSDSTDGSILNVICTSDGSTYYWYTSGMGTWADVGSTP